MELDWCDDWGKWIKDKLTIMGEAIQDEFLPPKFTNRFL